MPEPSADDALLRALREGRDEAYESLVRAETPRLLSVCRRILRSDEEARDAVQEAFISAFKALPSFEGSCRLSTWLHRIAVNACLMRLRSRKRRPEDSIEALLPAFRDDGHAAIDPRDFSPSAFELLERSETRAFVRAAIDELPDNYRVVLLLRDIEERDTSETAAILDVGEGVVKVRLHRARQALRRLLEQKIGEAS